MRIAVLLAMLLASCAGNDPNGLVITDQEPNDTPMEGGFLGDLVPGDTVTIFGTMDGTRDWYWFYLEEPMEIRVDVVSDGALIGVDDLTGRIDIVTDDRATATELTSASLFIVVVPLGGIGDYEIRITIAP